MNYSITQKPNTLYKNYTKPINLLVYFIRFKTDYTLTIQLKNRLENFPNGLLIL